MDFSAQIVRKALMAAQAGLATAKAPPLTVGTGSSGFLSSVPSGTLVIWNGASIVLDDQTNPPVGIPGASDAQLRQISRCISTLMARIPDPKRPVAARMAGESSVTATLDLTTP